MAGKQTKSNVFTDDGRLLQTEYAIKNVSQAGTITGLVCTDGVILIGIKSEPSSYLEKIYQLNDTTFCAVSGIFSDSLRIIKYARHVSANIREVINEDPKLSVLCDEISKMKQKYTQNSGARPFGVSFLYCRYEDNEYVLYATDPSGTVNRWRAWCFGIKEDLINTNLKNDLPLENRNCEESLKILLKLIIKAQENMSDTAKTMEILVYKKEGSSIVPVDKIEQLLAEIESKSKNKQ